MQRCLQAARGSAAPGPLARALLRYASSAAFQELPTVDVSALYGQASVAPFVLSAATMDQQCQRGMAHDSHRLCRRSGFLLFSIQHNSQHMDCHL